MSTKLQPTLCRIRAGFTLYFDNGYALSIRYGTGCDCENKDINGEIDPTTNNLRLLEQTATMEIAILDADKEFVWLQDGVLGHVPVDILPQLIVAVREGDESMFKMFIESIEEAR
jgi:hypothetical protein